MRQLLTVAAWIIVAAVAAQYLAGYLLLWTLDLDPLGASVLTTLRYLHHYGENAALAERVKVCTTIAWVLVLICAAVPLLPQRRALHGAASFARPAEARQAGLLASEGIILGKLRWRYVVLAGQQGAMVAAPPRSGKGVGIVVPNLLQWPGSVVTVDIKLENWTRTAGYRASCGHACYLFAPLSEDGRTARWNPLSYVSDNPSLRINDLQRIAEIIYPEVAGTDPFWVASARSLFVAIGLYLCETPSLPRTIGEILRQGMASDDEGFGAHWKRIIEGRKNGRNPLSAECVRALYDVIDLAPVTASSIRKTCTSRLDLWLNPILDAATSSDDFDLRELRRTPMAIYVGVAPDDLQRLRPVLSLFFQQAIGLQTRRLPEHDPSLRYQVLMVLDEFSALGRIPIISEAIGYLPGFNVRVLLVIQTPAQLRSVYGPHDAETIMKSLAARIVFAPRDFADAKEISDELGYTTVRARSYSRPRYGMWGRRAAAAGGSISESEQRRALLLPQEVQQLGSEKAIVFYEGLRPLLVRKIRYFKDARFRARLLPPPALPAPNWRPSSVRAPVSASPDLSSPADLPMNSTTAASTAVPAAESRPPTPEDIMRIEELTLDDFAVDLTKVKFPDHGGPLSEEEMTVAVQSFLSTLREQ